MLNSTRILSTEFYFFFFLVNEYLQSNNIGYTISDTYGGNDT